MTSYWSYRGAFVLQLDPATDFEAGRLGGRLEHLSSTRSARFGSVEELVAALKDLTAQATRTDHGQQPPTP
jgi:hypothetical protein